VSYDPRRGGHAPGHLRDAFLEWLDTGESTHTVVVLGEHRSLNWLCGQLWNCTDVLPGSECDLLDLPQGSTYAQAVQKVAAELDLLMGRR
jgi:hypothetical protein